MNDRSSSYGFRIRFNFPHRLCIRSDESELVISDKGATPVIKLETTEDDDQSDRKKSFNDTSRAALIGGPYESESAALEAGESWRSNLELAFAYMGIAVDFGDHALKGALTTEGIEWLKKNREDGRSIVNDTHGLMTYKTGSDPLFALSEANIKVQIASDQTLEIIRKTSAINLNNSDEERLAYHLYAASFFQPAADARFLTLMMAIETLVIERKEKSPKAIALVGSYIEELKLSGLSQPEKESLASGLKDLRYQSIGESCKQLAKALRGNSYHEMDPESFIKKCYALRSRLVHGQSPRPKREDVDLMAAQLELFVGNLLSYKLNIPFRR